MHACMYVCVYIGKRQLSEIPHSQTAVEALRSTIARRKGHTVIPLLSGPTHSL